MRTKRNWEPGILYTLGFNDFCRQISEKTDTPLKKTVEVIKATFESMAHNLYNQTAVSIKNFGIFYPYIYGDIYIDTPAAGKIFIRKKLIPKIRWSKKLRRNLELRVNFRKGLDDK